MLITNEERLGVLEHGLQDVRTDVTDIRKDIHELRNDLTGRPSWAVCIIITMLFGTCTSLAAIVASVAV
jgi:hypothetical protein